jgi:hypothetical protein
MCRLLDGKLVLEVGKLLLKVRVVSFKFGFDFLELDVFLEDLRSVFVELSVLPFELMALFGLFCQTCAHF